MPDSELSSPPRSPTQSVSSLIHLTGTPSQPPLESLFDSLQRPPITPVPILPPSSAYIFSAKLFSRELLPGPLYQIEYKCLFPNCTLPPIRVSNSHSTTSNLIKHYKNKHPLVKRSQDQTLPTKRPFSSISGL